jgi:hypothetical protein
MPAFQDLTGQRFGRLVVERRGGVHATPNGSRFTLWRCRCDCGGTSEVKANALRSGNTKSCGCLKAEVLHVPAMNPNRRHGAFNNGDSDPVYWVWSSMKARCLNPKDSHFAHYGGRGITVCERWRQSFAAFRDDMGPRPEGLEIDRINNDGNYEPGNCRWTTRSVQATNRRYLGRR